jgi:hypothetical protein
MLRVREIGEPSAFARAIVIFDKAGLSRNLRFSLHSAQPPPLWTRKSGCTFCCESKPWKATLAPSIVGEVLEMTPLGQRPLNQLYP